MPIPIARPLAILSCLAVLAGCKLVDQRTFDHSAGRAPVPAAAKVTAQGPAPIPPLYVVQAGALETDWQSGLHDAARAALERKANVLFTVESVVPSSGSPDQQAAALQAAVASLGRPVAEALTADGAQPAQIEMTAVSEPSLRNSEVRVFVH